MPGLSDASVEGRLLAQRKLLAFILSELVRGDAGGRWEAFAEQRAVFQDGEEDPGVVPSEAQAVEAALADEIRQIAELVRMYRRD
jgi:hypothetical protein